VAIAKRRERLALLLRGKSQKEALEEEMKAGMLATEEIRRNRMKKRRLTLRRGGRRAEKLAGWKPHIHLQ